MVVPGAGRIIINPYRLPVDEGGSTAQIVHEAQALYNYGPSPVTVNVSVVGTVSEGSEAVLVSEAPAAGRKEVFLYAEFQNIPDGWTETYTGAPNQLIASEDGSRGENILTLDAEGEAYFRISGAMSNGTVWADTDTFGAVLMFTFSPAPAESAGYAGASEELSALEETSVPEEIPVPDETPTLEEAPALEEVPVPEGSAAPEMTADMDMDELSPVLD